MRKFGVRPCNVRGLDRLRVVRGIDPVTVVTVRGKLVRGVRGPYVTYLRVLLSTVGRRELSDLCQPTLGKYRGVQYQFAPSRNLSAQLLVPLYTPILPGLSIIYYEKVLHKLYDI